MQYTMELSNLIIIPLLGGMILSSSKQHQHNKSIVYTSEDLKNIRDDMYHDHYYRKLSSQTVKTIRNLRINNKKKNRRGSKVGSISKNINQQRSANLSNLIRINSDELPRNRANQKTIKLSTINVQSVENKDMILHQYLCDNKIDLCLLTETSLTDSDIDKLWISCTSLNNGSHRMDTSHMIGQQGGGLALISSNILIVTKIDEENKDYFSLPFGKYPVKNIQSASLVSITHHILL